MAAAPGIHLASLSEVCIHSKNCIEGQLKRKIKAPGIHPNQADRPGDLQICTRYWVQEWVAMHKQRRNQLIQCLPCVGCVRFWSQRVIRTNSSGRLRTYCNPARKSHPVLVAFLNFAPEYHDQVSINFSLKVIVSNIHSSRSCILSQLKGLVNKTSSSQRQDGNCIRGLIKSVFASHLPRLLGTMTSARAVDYLMVN